MKPKYGKQPLPSLAPKFDDLISILQSAQTFHSTGPNKPNDDEQKQRDSSQQRARTFPLMPLPPDIIARQKAKRAQIAKQMEQENIIKTATDDEKQSVSSATSTNKYVTDLKGKETETMKMIMNECKVKGLTSARLFRAPPQYYQETIEWRRDILGAPHIKYLCKSLLMKNIRCTNNDCNDPTNSLFYLVIFVCFEFMDMC